MPIQSFLTSGDGADHATKAVETLLSSSPEWLQRLWTLNALLFFRPLHDFASNRTTSFTRSLTRIVASDLSWWGVRFLRAWVLRPIIWLLTRPFRFTRVRVALLLVAVIRLVEWLRDLDRTYRHLSSTGSAARLQTPSRSASASLARPFPSSLSASNSTSTSLISTSSSTSSLSLSASTSTSVRGQPDAGKSASEDSLLRARRALFASGSESDGTATSSVSFRDIPLVLPSRAKASSRSLRLAPSLRKSITDLAPIMNAAAPNSGTEGESTTHKHESEDSTPVVEPTEANEQTMPANTPRKASIPLYSGSPITTEKLESEMDSIRASLRSEIDRVKKLNEEREAGAKKPVSRKSNAKMLRQQYDQVLQMQIQSGITASAQPQAAVEQSTSKDSENASMAKNTDGQ